MRERYEIFTTLINRISRNTRKIKNLGMAEYNLRNMHVSCIYQLYISEGITATELCERCEEDKATISRAVDFLEKEGYLTCRSKTVKRYKSPIVLTEKGMEIGEKIANKIDVVLNEVSIGLTDEERVKFYKYLAIISDNLDNITKEFEKKKR